MSYILDALRKIEQKRDREDPLRKPTFSGELPPERKKRALWPYILLAVLLLNAIVVMFLVGSHKTDRGGAVARAPLPPQQPPVVATTEDKGAIREAVKDRKEVLQKKDLVPPPGRTVEKEAKESVTPVPAKPVVTGRPSVVTKTGQEKGTVPVSEKVYSLSELPSAVRSALPEFKVSGHAYGPDRQTRVARVNDKILQEGQELAPGLRLEEITPDGIIFSYQGYRFRVRIDGNR